MNDPDLPSDSDLSDEDYRPSGEESNAASEEEESGPDEDVINNLNEDEVGEDNKKKNGTSRPTKKTKRKAKVAVKRKIKAAEEAVNVSDDVKEEKKSNPEEQKKKADSLWADFLKDCDGPAKKKPSLDSSTIGNSSTSNNLEKSNISVVEETSSSCDKKTITEEKENKSTVTQIFEFAGEKITVEKAVTSNTVVNDNGKAKSPATSFAGRGRGRGSSALSSFLGQLGKKGKLSTLEKSKLDWDTFKKQEGINEDIQKHNKGKDGYLEKQDFLQRTDLRRFEIEKSFRQKRSGR